MAKRLRLSSPTHQTPLRLSKLDGRNACRPREGRREGGMEGLVRVLAKRFIFVVLPVKHHLGFHDWIAGVHAGLGGEGGREGGRKGRTYVDTPFLNTSV